MCAIAQITDDADRQSRAARSVDMSHISHEAYQVYAKCGACKFQFAPKQRVNTTVSASVAGLTHKSNLSQIWKNLEKKAE